ncbi:MAG: transketolase [Sphaerochaetaceae bacterium]|jgi:transketolase
MNKHTQSELLELQKQALAVRKNILRMVKAGGSGHVGGALSATDIITTLYFSVMNVKPEDPNWADRDRFVLSAGHKCLALYAVLAEKGFFDKAILDTYGSLNSPLPGHPDMHALAGVESNTGALGHGLAIAGGMAMGLKLDRKKSRVYVIMGDGELAEGSNWEAAAAASHHKLDNLMVFVDLNGLQIGGQTSEIMANSPLADRWRAFGWHVKEIDGHNIEQILACTDGIPFETGKPTVVIANTVKSKGFSFAEGKASYHYWSANDQEMAVAEEDLQKAERSLQQ